MKVESIIEKYRSLIIFFLAFLVISSLICLYFIDKESKSSVENPNYKVLEQKVADLEKEVEQAKSDDTYTLVTTQTSMFNDDSKQTTKININTADSKTLQNITGIGEKKAQDIINYRQQSGGFKSIEEIKNIKGIGDATFEKMKNQITI